MVSLKSLWPPLAAILVLASAALVGFPLYVHYEVAQATGAYAPLYMYEHSPYDTITVEVHYQADAAPSDAALGLLKQRLATYTGKRVEIEKYGDLPSGVVTGRVDDDSVSAIGEGIIQKYGHTGMGWLGGNIPIYIIYVDAQGPATNDSEDTVVGLSYRADSFIVLKNNIDGVGLEKAVLVHETGHLLGLDHCNDSGCVMAAVMSLNKSWKGDDGPPTDFCAPHRKELADRRQNLFYNAGKVFQGGTSASEAA